MLRIHGTQIYRYLSDGCSRKLQEPGNRINQINPEIMLNNMKPIVIAILGAAALLFLLSCSDKQNKDITSTVNKDGSVETAVQVEHLNSEYDVLVTTHKVWVHNAEFKTVTYRDTLPSLGMMNKEAENEDGDTKNIRVQKEYEIFLTIK